MERRILEITLQYATDLNKVNFISKMNVYVVVSISGGDKNSRQKTITTVDHDGDANPMWRFPMKFMVEEAALLQNRLMLDFKIKCERALGDKDIGEVHVPIKDLLDSPAKGRGGANKFVSYQVKKPSGKPKGHLTFSYQFRKKTTTTSAAPPPAEKVYGESMTPYPTVEPISPYSLMVPGGYRPPPSQPVTVAPEGCGGHYPPPAEYPPDGWPTPEWYAPPPPGCGCPPPPPSYSYQPPPPGYVYPPQFGFGYLPPMMQLAPNWWIVDWRYDSNAAHFDCNGGPYFCWN